jgi:hypothetical protein
MATTWAHVPINVCNRRLWIHNRIIGSSISVHTILTLISLTIKVGKVQGLGDPKTYSDRLIHSPLKSPSPPEKPRPSQWIWLPHWQPGLQDLRSTTLGTSPQTCRPKDNRSALFRVNIEYVNKTPRYLHAHWCLQIWHWLCPRLRKTWSSLTTQIAYWYWSKQLCAYQYQYRGNPGSCFLQGY